MHHPELINDEMIHENDLILHGHTHRYKLEEKEGSSYLILESVLDL